MNNIKTIRIYGHCVDTFGAEFIKADGSSCCYDGYVPEGMGVGGGDDIYLEIDKETGKILNWKPLQDEQVAMIIAGI